MHQFPALYNYHEAAKLLTISEATLRRRVMNGTAPHRKIGRSVRFTPEDLAAIVEAVPADGGSR